MRRLLIAIVLCFLVACSPENSQQSSQAVAEGAGSTTSGELGEDSPNVLLVLSDDQSTDLMSAMPITRDRIGEQGVTFENAYVSQSLCCPSRASILRGQYPHNHGITSNGVAGGGGEPEFREQNLDESTFATWAQDAGYRTGFVGKYMNQYEGSYVPPGWDSWVAKINPPGGGHSLNVNGRIVEDESKYMTDLYRNRAKTFLGNATDSPDDPPFVLTVWPSSPHLPAPSAGRHADLFKSDDLDRTPAFNEADVSDKPEWVRELPPITDKRRLDILQAQRAQKRSLQGLDEMVGDLIGQLRRSGELDNTYIVFTSDNGVHMGSQRYFDPRGAKDTPYEPSANVPLLVRGPGVARGAVRDELALNNDLAPTIAGWIGADAPDFVDGRSLGPVLGETAPEAWRTALLNERHRIGKALPPNYDALIGGGRSYVEWATGEKEMYDLQADPYQLENLLREPTPEAKAKAAELSARLDTLKDCAGDSCRAAEDAP